MASQLSAAFEELVKAGRLPGVGAIVLDKSGKTIYNEAFGTINANEENAKSFTNDTQMLVWSCTKFITCISALQLLEQGKIGSIDDPVAKYLPREAEIMVCEKLDENGDPVLRKPKTEMKLVHLFTHTSGHTYDFWESDELLYKYRLKKDQAPGTYVGLNAEWQFYDVFLGFDPGAKHHYGSSIDRLGFIVEKLSGMPLEEYMAKNVFEPCGVKDATPQFINNDWLRCHIKDGQGKLTAVETIQPGKEPWKYGGGHFLLTSLNSYAQILLAILNDGTHPHTGKQILKPETVKDYVFKDFIPHVGAPNTGIGKCPVSLVPGLSNAGDVGNTFRDSEARGWSCGLMLNNEDAPGARKAGSGAWAGLGNLYYWIDRTAGVTGIIGTSVLPFLDQDSLDLFEKVERFAYA